MLLFEKDTPLENLPFKIYKSLVKELNKNSAWKVMAKYLAEEVDSFGMSWVDSLDEEASVENARKSPAELLMDDLLDANTCITVGIFCDMVKHCHLLDTLLVLHCPDHSVTIDHLYSSSSGKVIKVSLGETISIACRATDFPSPKYQWFHGNVQLPDQTADSLSLLITSWDQEGDYNCRVDQYNDIEKLVAEEFSECVSLTINSTRLVATEQSASVEVKSTDDANEDKWNLYGETCRNFQVDYLPQKATTKVALLIANGNYQNEGPILTAENDATVISTLLKKIGFHVIYLHNLALKEMRNAVQIFCAALIPDSYGLFYFVGHGFRTQGLYMMPIDVRRTFLPYNAYSENEFLSNVLQKKPALLVVILDVKLAIPPKKLNPGIYNEIPYSWTSNCKGTLILAYSTCDYEYTCKPNYTRRGIYVSHLSKHITSNKPVCELFIGVAQSVAKSMNDNAGRQESMLTIIPTEPQRYLTDEVICEVSGLPSPCNSYLFDLTTFKPRTVEIKFPQSSVTCEVTIQPARASYLNAVLLTTSGLEEWEVSFHSSDDDRTKLYPMNRQCFIYNPQRITTKEQGSLVIKIGKNGRVHKSIRFFFMKYVPKLVNALWRE